MTRRIRRLRERRAAFTLIELLVVIAIIAVLVSLTAAAAQRVRIAGTQTDNFHRIKKIEQGISAAKSSRDQMGLNLAYIPSEPMTNGGFTLKSAYTGTEPELNVLLTAWPQLNTAATGLPNVTLDPNQTLMFFLTGGAVTNFTGFSTNPKAPFTVAVAGESRRGPYIELTPKMIGAGPNNQPWLLDSFGNPYVYFASVGGKVGNYAAQTYNGVSPYKDPTSGKFVNESGVQIISAGKNGQFGPGGTALPASGAGEDDQANFTRSLLGGGISN